MGLSIFIDEIQELARRAGFDLRGHGLEPAAGADTEN
jgi:hypothetical protein